MTGAAALELRVDALGLDDLADLVTGVLHAAVQPQRLSAEDFRAITSQEVGKRALHQPPLRPEAPNPATSCSSTATRSVGSARRR